MASINEDAHPYYVVISSIKTYDVALKNLIKSIPTHLIYIIVYQD